MMLIIPCIVLNILYVIQINHKMYLAYNILVKLNCHLFWQVQYFLKFCDIIRTQNNAFFFFQRKCISKIGQIRSPKRRVRNNDFIVESYSKAGEAEKKAEKNNENEGKGKSQHSRTIYKPKGSIIKNVLKIIENNTSNIIKEIKAFLGIQVIINHLNKLYKGSNILLFMFFWQIGPN